MKEFLEDVRDYYRTHTFTEIVSAVWRSCIRHPVEFATLIIALISLGVSSGVIGVAILSQR